MTRIIGCIFLAFTLFCTQGVIRGEEKHGGKMGKDMFANNECLAKGGFGIVNTQLYIDLKSDKNELLMGTEYRWVGQGASKREMVVVFQNKIWLPGEIPNGFALSEAVIISFEVDKVWFFDFSKMSGGYYRRPE